MKKSRLLGAVCACFISIPSVGLGATFQWLEIDGEASDLSSDGNVIVGSGWRWTAAGGYESINDVQWE